MTASHSETDELEPGCRDLETDIGLLEQHLADNKFACSLASQYRQGRRLSSKQMQWVHKLAQEHGPDAPEPTIDFASLNGRFSDKQRGKPRGFAVSKIGDGSVDVIWVFPGERIPHGYARRKWAIGSSGELQLVSPPPPPARKPSKHPGSPQRYATKSQKRKARNQRRAARAVGAIARMIGASQ